MRFSRELVLLLDSGNSNDFFIYVPRNPFMIMSECLGFESCYVDLECL